MIRRPPRSTPKPSSAASDVYKRQYLHSRIKGFEFPHPFPMKPDNTPQFQLTDQSWKSFFERLWTQLDLSDQEEEGQHGESQRAFQCSARSANEHI